MEPTTPQSIDETEPLAPTDLANRIYVMTATTEGAPVASGIGVFADQDQAYGWALETTRETLATLPDLQNNVQVSLVVASLNDSQVSAALAQILLLRPDLFDQTFARLNTPE